MYERRSLAGNSKGIKRTSEQLKTAPFSLRVSDSSTPLKPDTLPSSSSSSITRRRNRHPNRPRPPINTANSLASVSSLQSSTSFQTRGIFRAIVMLMQGLLWSFCIIPERVSEVNLNGYKAAGQDFAWASYELGEMDKL
ncbi:unnamed protein product [Vicia faba]|uniref:Uncharacterized protein n=1 Tax=Vicia faba TaxID=3906 RepID=A0AAV1B6X4_VICFA|nr:unnamed protein product [Vicia faba]